jgi:hypothetical protein
MVKTSVLIPMAIKCIQELNTKHEAEKAAHQETKQELAALKAFIQSKFPGEF